MDKIQTIRNNQKVIHEEIGDVIDKLKEYDKRFDEQGLLIKEQGTKIEEQTEHIKELKECNDHLTGKIDFISLGWILEASCCK